MAKLSVTHLHCIVKNDFGLDTDDIYLIHFHGSIGTPGIHINKIGPGPWKNLHSGDHRAQNVQVSDSFADSDVNLLALIESDVNDDLDAATRKKIKDFLDPFWQAWAVTVMGLKSTEIAEKLRIEIALAIGTFTTNDDLIGAAEVLSFGHKKTVKVSFRGADDSDGVYRLELRRHD